MAAPKRKTAVDEILQSLLPVLETLSIDRKSIVVRANGFSIPSANIAVNLKLSKGLRVWQACETYSVVDIETEADRQVTTILFEIAMTDVWQLVRKVALRIATVRIDGKIDELS